MPALETSKLLPKTPLETLLKPSTSELLYAAAPLEQLNEAISKALRCTQCAPVVTSAFSPREFLEGEEIVLEDENEGSLSAGVLWAAQEGAVAQLHYDKAHNMFTVLQGNKTFWLLPPSAWPQLPLFPAFHPLSRCVIMPTLSPMQPRST
eukprot:TRINITY_DN7492_c0_g1_i1.p2 TRINITY_DN7492_c0_g1~~TRINITY_DN7492_c0_g1_i1.p2  ORF type:complete len:150 (+),score=33.52 TRINITY_DN7492_c0_g1_i1:337-786(+)